MNRMVFRDHARVGLLWLGVMYPLRVLRYLPPRAHPARPSVSFVASAPRPLGAPVVGAPCSRSSARVRLPRPLSAFVALVPRSCMPRSARSCAGAHSAPRCARHSVRAAQSLPPPSCASTHAAIGARPAPVAPRATPLSPAVAPRIVPAAPLSCPHPAARRFVLVVAAVHVYAPSLYFQYSRFRLLVFLSWLRCSRRQPAPLPCCCCLLPRVVARCVHRAQPHLLSCVASTLSGLLSHCVLCVCRAHLCCCSCCWSLLQCCCCCLRRCSHRFLFSFARSVLHLAHHLLCAPHCSACRPFLLLLLPCCCPCPAVCPSLLLCWLRSSSVLMAAVSLPRLCRLPFVHRLRCVPPGPRSSHAAVCL